MPQNIIKDKNLYKSLGRVSAHQKTLAKREG